MNTKQIMIKAWKIAKKAAQYRGGKASEYFAVALADACRYAKLAAKLANKTVRLHNAFSVKELVKSKGGRFEATTKAWVITGAAYAQLVEFFETSIDKSGGAAAWNSSVQVEIA